MKVSARLAQAEARAAWNAHMLPPRLADTFRSQVPPPASPAAPPLRGSDQRNMPSRPVDRFTSWRNACSLTTAPARKPTPFEDSRRATPDRRGSAPAGTPSCYSRYDLARARVLFATHYEKPFDPSEHPRAPAGGPDGGQFVATGTGKNTNAVRHVGPQQADVPSHEEAHDQSELGVADLNRFPPKEDLAQPIDPPSAQLFESRSGQRFAVSFDQKWKFAPQAGLQVPTLNPADTDKFVDFLERGSALRDAITGNSAKRKQIDDAIKWRSWRFLPFSSEELGDMQSRDQLDREAESLQQEWSKLEAEFQREGFAKHKVTGYREGFSDDLRQDTESGEGLTSAVRAYQKSQEAPLRGGVGVQPTYDEMALISAPADIIGAIRLGGVVLRGGYQVVKEGGRFVLRKQAVRLVSDGADEFAMWATKAEAHALARDHATRLLEIARREEPAITDAMRSASTTSGGVLERLPACLKSEDSLTRKIAERVLEKSPEPLSHSAIVSRIEEAATNQYNTNDVLRYTVSSPSTDLYYATRRSVQESLESQGFKQIRSTDFWKRMGTRSEIGYRGINSTFQSPTGQLFEVQFHTPESLRMAERLHGLYEELRALGTLPERREIIRRLMKQEWYQVDTPRH